MLKGKLLKVILIILYIIAFIDNYIYIFLSILAIFIHEIFHILYLKINCIESIDLKFSILGFKIDLYDNLSMNKTLFLYLIGSLSNMLLALLIYIFNKFLRVDLLNDFVGINLIIGIINLVPVFPLDGIAILRNILFRVLGYRNVEIISIFVSFISCFMISLLGFYLYYMGLIRFNITYISIFLFIFISTCREYTLFKYIDSINVYCYNKKEVSFRSVLIPLSSSKTLADIIKLHRCKNLDIIYIINDEFEIVDILTMRGVIAYYNIYGNVNIRDYFK